MMDFISCTCHSLPSHERQECKNEQPLLIKISEQSHVCRCQLLSENVYTSDCCLETCIIQRFDSNKLKLETIMNLSYLALHTFSDLQTVFGHDSN